MSTYLELCQKVAQESGVVAGVQPLTVVGQTDTLKKIVDWTKDAWVFIQTYHDNWPWMRSTFSTQTIANTSSYTAAYMALTDHDRFMGDKPGYRPVSIFLTATGVSDTTPVKEITYEQWQTTYGRGTQTAAKPIHYCISPAGVLLLGPTPDAVYTLNGEYYRSPQVFSANTDTPTGLKAKFHNLIAYRALMRLALFDESAPAYQNSKMLFDELFNTLEREADRITMKGGFLA
jgi:hypothetical protein